MNKWRPNHRFFSNLAVVLIGITFYLAMSNLDLVHGALKTVMDVLAPFIWGFAVAYLLDAPVRWFEKKLGGRRMLSVSMLINNASSYLDNLNGVVNDWGDRLNIDPEVISGMMLSYTDLMNKATVLVTAFIPQILNYGMAVGSGVVSALTAFIASVYMLMDKHKLLSQLHKITYAFLPLPKARRMLTVCSHANQVFSGFIIGKIIDSAIIGVICFVGMSVLGMPFTLLISMIVGVTNVIPFFGPFIGAIPSIMILLMASPIDAIKFAIFVLALQQFDGNILGPKILGDSTGLSAIWVLVAIIVGGGLFGFAGMVVGVPTFAVLYSLTSDFLADRLKAKGLTANGEPLEPESAVPSEETLPENQ